MRFVNPIPFRIKLCGFQRPEDVVAAIEAGADAIGLNFYKKSSRYVELAKAAELSSIGEGRLAIVGVFVDPTLDEIQNVLSKCRLDFIQLHGSEKTDLVINRRIPPVIKALCWRPENLEDAEAAQDWSAHRQETKLAGILIDAYDSNLRGGTGRAVRWDVLFPRPKPLETQPLVLAGGLTPGNVAEAIEISRCDAVDTASGIEIEPGIKDKLKMNEFVKEARKCFEPAA